MTNMDELIRLLSRYVVWDKDYVVIKTGMYFEPHGEASETFEVVWLLELPTIQYYWYSTDGWTMGRPGLAMTFHGKSLDSVINQAVSFMEWFNERWNSG